MTHSSNLARERPGVPLVRSVERAMAILRAFSPDSAHLSLSELSRRTGLDKSTTRRLLHTLAHVELVEYDEAGLRYSLAPSILMLVPAVSYGRDLRNAAAPVLARLTEVTGATSFLWSYFRGQALCLDRVKARDLHIDAPWSAIGTRISLNCGSGPRVILAHISEEERAVVLHGHLPRHTPSTQTDPAKLQAAASIICQRGWELAVDDYVVGLAGLGVPVLDRTGTFVASISITTLTPHLATEKDRPPHLDAMLEAAAEIGACLYS